MKKYIAYILIIIPLITFAQKSFYERNPNIDKHIDYIESLSDTTVVILNNDDFTEDNYDGGSSLIGVFHNNELVKIISWFGISYGINSSDYYLKNGELYLVIENFKGFKYDTKKDEFDYSEFDIVAQGIYLFESDTLIDSESLGHWRFEDDSVDPEGTLLSEFKNYVESLIK